MKTVSPILVGAAALAESAGAHRPAFYVLLAAVPMTFAAGLKIFGDFVDGESSAEDLDLMRLALHVLALGFVLLAVALPRLTSVACVGALAALGLASLLQFGERMPGRLLVVLRGQR